MYDKEEEVGKRRMDKSQIICGKRAINYDVLNCRSLGQANYQREVEAGGLAPPCFANRRDRWLPDCHRYDSVTSDQIMFTINRAEVTRRHQGGNEHVIRQTVSGADGSNNLEVNLISFFFPALSLSIVLIIAAQGLCRKKNDGGKS